MESVNINIINDNILLVIKYILLMIFYGLLGGVWFVESGGLNAWLGGGRLVDGLLVGVWAAPCSELNGAIRWLPPVNKVEPPLNYPQFSVVAPSS